MLGPQGFWFGLQGVCSGSWGFESGGFQVLGLVPCACLSQGPVGESKFGL